MRGLNLQAMQAQQPQQSQGLLSPQTLGMLMQAYKAYQGQQAGQTPGDTGTGYAPTGTQGQPGINGAGYGIGSPVVAGGASGQPMQGSDQNPLLQAMIGRRQQTGPY